MPKRSSNHLEQQYGLPRCTGVHWRCVVCGDLVCGRQNEECFYGCDPAQVFWFALTEQIVVCRKPGCEARARLGERREVEQ